jgi:hypothetical protein
MKSTLFAFLLSLGFQGSAFAQLQFQYLDQSPPATFVGWEHAVADAGVLFLYDGPCSIDGGHLYPGEAVLLRIQNFGDDVTLSYQMSLVCGGASVDWPSPSIDNAVFSSQIIADWNALGQPDSWDGQVTIPGGFDSGPTGFYQIQGSIGFFAPQGSCCVNSGCASLNEATCAELGGTWTEDGSCDDCEPVSDDCPADVDGDGIPDACDADSNIESPYGGATYWDPAEGGNGHWYAILEKPESASEMLQIAEDLGAHVATIGSEVEDSFLRSITQPFFQEAVILGGQQIGSTQTFAWVDGTPFDYAAWAPGEPNGVNPDEWIAYYESSSNSYQGWHDVTFSDTSVTRFALEWSIDDCNSNGIIDSCEIVPDDCGNEAEPCPADVDGDGSIGFSDVLIILNDWGACP